ncbi:hypothetical protein HCN44_006280 [Aphidius gifuensis]|uniref:Chitin-binding type-2 domain-containing protein n=1 Tax=Aphidius gifuensis TaxID=684658 RepID=A0A834XW23_APHGI|nr:protein obstructor-E-like [Aphidius gifuensis]KAF7993220.1 hypothetical protein HCN44_006280 [Aphidius gifuensis]
MSYSTLSVAILAIIVISSCNGQFQRQRQVVDRNRVDYNKKPVTSPATPASCPDKQGRYPVQGQCDAYIECIDGVPTEKLCPDGLLFNINARFNYPCGYPIDVNCEGRPQLQRAAPTDDCPHQYGYFKLGDDVDCGRFMNCVDGVGFEFNCPEGLAFSKDTYRCDYPDQVSDCNAEAYLKFTCPPVEQNSFLQDEIRLLRSPHDCQHYYLCVRGQPRLLSCGEGNAFNELTNACDAAENVTGCEPPFMKEDPTGPQSVRRSRTRLFN